MFLSYTPPTYCLVITSVTHLFMRTHIQIYSTIFFYNSNIRFLSSVCYIYLVYRQNVAFFAFCVKLSKNTTEADNLSQCHLRCLSDVLEGIE